MQAQLDLVIGNDVCEVPVLVSISCDLIKLAQPAHLLTTHPSPTPAVHWLVLHHRAAQWCCDHTLRPLPRLLTARLCLPYSCIIFHNTVRSPALALQYAILPSLTARRSQVCSHSNVAVPAWVACMRVDVRGGSHGHNTMHLPARAVHVHVCCASLLQASVHIITLSHACFEPGCKEGPTRA
jgi:hypothetical protein